MLHPVLDPALLCWHRRGGGSARVVAVVATTAGTHWELGKASSIWKAALLLELILGYKVSTADAMTFA